jgi:adenosine deaminase
MNNLEQGGLKRTTHTGEDDLPPQNIKICLDLLKCDRIDHGYTVLNDEMLLRECIEREVLFTVVPTNSHYFEILAGQD